MELILGILVVVMGIGNGMLGYILSKSITLNRDYEDIHENIHEELSNLSVAIEDLLAKEIYSDEPTIMRFVEVLTELQPFLQSLNPDLTFGVFNGLGEDTRE
jgi:hypothetical protein